MKSFDKKWNNNLNIGGSTRMLKAMCIVSIAQPHTVYPRKSATTPIKMSW